MMKRVITLLTLLLSINAIAQNVGIGTATPNASAKLDISATDKGLLPPRIALTALNAASPITTPATGLLIYNTATAGTAPNNVVPGYYYWGGSAWIRFVHSTPSTPAGFPKSVVDVTSTQNVTIPANTRGIEIKAVGAGGGGGGYGSTNDAAGGGGAGGYVEIYLNEVHFAGNTSLTIAIGAAGAGGGATSNNGGTGGNTVISLTQTSATIAIANGGTGGTNGNSYAAGGTGGTYSISSGFGYGVNGDDGQAGRDNGTDVNNQNGGTGGASLLGGGGRGATETTNAEAGSYGGGGGGGARDGNRGGVAGGSGRAVIIFY